LQYQPVSTGVKNPSIFVAIALDILGWEKEKSRQKREKGDLMK